MLEGHGKAKRPVDLDISILAAFLRVLRYMQENYTQPIHHENRQKNQNEQ